MRTRIWHSDWKPRWLIRCVSAALLSFMDKQDLQNHRHQPIISKPYPKQTRKTLVNDNNLLKEELEELNNLEDVYEDIVTTSDLFSISSFGVDYPVETLVSRMRSELFYIPDFQRQFVWSQNQSSRFVESLLLGLPVPGIFLFKEPETGRHLVIDGQQRLKSLLFFCDGLFKGREFRLTGLESEWEGQTHITLSDADRARLADAVIHATVFKQDLPQNDTCLSMKVRSPIPCSCSCLSPTRSQRRRRELHGADSDMAQRLETAMAHTLRLGSLAELHG